MSAKKNSEDNSEAELEKLLLHRLKKRCRFLQSLLIVIFFVLDFSADLLMKIYCRIFLYFYS